MGLPTMVLSALPRGASFSRSRGVPMPYPSPADEHPDDAINAVLLVVLVLMILIGVPMALLGL